MGRYFDMAINVKVDQRHSCKKKIMGRSMSFDYEGALQSQDVSRIWRIQHK